MTSLPNVSLDVATELDAELLSNLLELYAHDLSAVFPALTLGTDGRYGYPRLPLYWTESHRRFAFLIRCAGEVAGFAFATHEVAERADLTTMDVAEFFILRRYRRFGVGRRAATLLWNKFPGRWTVRVAASNDGALVFWDAVIAEAVGASILPSTRVDGLMEWRVYSFQSRALR